jgi:Tol biopolymer transport system component
MALRVAVVVLVVAVAALAVPAVRHLREQPPPPPPAIDLTLGPPSGAELGSGDDALDAAISPDERQLVFVASRSGATMLWRRPLASDRAEPIPDTEGAQLPAWGPDNLIAYFAGGQLRRVSLSTGEAVDLAEASSPSGATWLRDGTLLFSPRADGPIRRLAGGVLSDATTLRPGERGHVFPAQAGPAGDFTYTTIDGTGRRTVHLVRGSDDRALTATSGHGQAINGYLLYVRDDVLLAQRLTAAGALDGRAHPVITGVGVSAAGRGLFAASSRVALAAAHVPRARELAWFDLEGRRAGTLGEAGDFWQVRLSPDDRFAAVTVVAPLLRTLDIVLVPTDISRKIEPLTLALAADSDPVWSPDGLRVLFRSLQRGRPALFTRRAHAADAEDEVLADVDGTPTEWRTSGVLYQARENASGYDIWSLNPASGARQPFIKSGFNDSDGRWSPDGNWVAFVSDESGRPEIYVVPKGGSPRVRVSTGGGSRPRWSRDGRTVYFLRGTTIVRASLEPGSPARVAPAAPVLDAPGIRDFDVAHARDAIIALLPASSEALTPVRAMTNWQSVLPPRP